MLDTLGKLAAPVVWIGVASVVLGIVAHLTPAGMLFRVTASAYLDFTGTCFLFAIAAGVTRIAENK